MRRIAFLYIIYLALFLVSNTKEIFSATENHEKSVLNKNSSYYSKLYVALGDSFASGLGAKDYILSSGSCFRSKNAFSIDEEYGIAKIYSFIPKFYACAGATQKTLLKSQVNKHKALLKKAGLVTVIIGGNDVDFSEILSFCIFIKDCENYLSGEIINIKKKIDDQRYTLINTFKALRNVSPRAQIYVLGYPFLFNRKYDANCSISEFIDPEEQEFLNNITERLNRVIEEASINSGIVFLSVTEAFSGHEIC